MIRWSAIVAAARQLEATTRANACDAECERCRGTIAAARRIAKRGGAA